MWGKIALQKCMANFAMRRHENVWKFPLKVGPDQVTGCPFQLCVINTNVIIREKSLSLVKTFLEYFEYPTLLVIRTFYDCRTGPTFDSFQRFEFLLHLLAKIIHMWVIKWSCIWIGLVFSYTFSTTNNFHCMNLWHAEVSIWNVHMRREHNQITAVSEISKSMEKYEKWMTRMWCLDVKTLLQGALLPC